MSSQLRLVASAEHLSLLYEGVRLAPVIFGATEYSAIVKTFEDLLGFSVTLHRGPYRGNRNFEGVEVRKRRSEVAVHIGRMYPSPAPLIGMVTGPASDYPPSDRTLWLVMLQALDPDRSEELTAFATLACCSFVCEIEVCIDPA